MVHEQVAGRELQISARSFFQSRADGAAMLVEEVATAAGDSLDSGSLVDAYGGVGLFGACLAGADRVVLVEENQFACRDAAINLRHRDATIVNDRVERWLPDGGADLVVADPPRAGLGTDGVTSVVATGARRIVLVSCDPATLARDARRLEAEGYRHVSTTVVDLFPHTPHVETVTRFDAGE